MDGKSRLTPKQQRFVEEYLIDRNATAAADRAGYKQPNSQGPRLLVNVGIRIAIDEETAEQSKRTGITADKVLYELAGIGFAEVDAKITQGDKIRALELLGKHLEMLPEKVKIEDERTARIEAALRELTDDQLLAVEASTDGGNQIESDREREVSSRAVALDQ